MKVGNLMYIISYVHMMLNSVYSKNKALFYVFLTQIWIVMTFNLTIPDRGQYLAMYEGTARSAYIGGSILYKLGNLLGLTYVQFLGVYIAVGLLLIATTIRKYSNSPGIALTLYFCFPFFIDAPQLRNFLVMAIVIKAIPYLNDKSKKGLAKFVGIILLATLFHYSALFFMTLLLTRYFDVKKLLIICLSITGVFLIFNDQLPIIMTTLLPFAATKINAALTVTDAILVEKNMIIFFIGNIIMLYMGHLKNKELYDNLDLAEQEQWKMKPEFSELILKVNIVLLFVFPALLYSGEFFRWFRSLIIYSYILFSNVFLIRMKETILKKVYDVVFLILFFAVFLWSFWYFEFKWYYHPVITKLFDENTFIRTILESLFG